MAFTLGTKFNEGTDWEFTVSNETLAEAVQAEGGIKEADIADYCYVGLIDARVVAMLAESTRNSNDGLYPWAMEFCAAYNTNNGAHPSKVQMNVNQKEQNPVTCYQRNVITYYGTIGNKTGHFLVMDMANIKKWIMDYDVYPAYQAGTVTSTTGFPGYTGTCYVYNEANVARVTPYQAEGSPTADLYLMNIFATEDTLWIGALNPTAHSKEKISNEKLSHAGWEFDYAAADTYNANYTNYIYQAGPTSMQGWSNFPDAQFPDPSGNTTVFDSYLECDDAIDGIVRVFGQYGNSQNPYITNCEQGNIVKTLHGVHTVESWGGLLFKDNNIIYKPIIEGGLVTGFTSDMDIPSEWDNMTNVTGNNISPTPPSGGGGTPGEWDDMPGSGSSIGALAGARCYICSKTDITNLKTWMSKTEGDGGPPDGYDVLSSLISVMAFPIDMTSASSGPATAITFTGLKTATDNQLANIAAALLSIANSVGATPKTEIKTFTSTATALPSAGNPFTIDLGTCTCPTFYSSDFPFADYDASVELYLPFIGTMTLDTQTVMGNSLHAYMSVDPITGAIYAWCECTKNGSRVVVASGSGAIGVNTPITANQVGMAMAQIKNNAAQSRQTAIQSALTLGVGAIAGMDKNISSILSRNMTAAIGQRSANIAIATGRDYADALSVGASQAAMTALPNAIGANLNTGRANRQIAQANHNSVSGSAGGSTADWSCSYTPYLKIITPDVHRAGEQYEHTYGVPTIQSGTLSTFKGLTFCANPDVSSISTATDQEKQQIFGLLAGGVYV